MLLPKITTLFVCLCYTAVLIAQGQPNASSESAFQRTSALDKSLVTPNSPEASSLGKFGEFKFLHDCS